MRVGLERIAGKLRLSVSDRGAGIPEDFRPRLFQRFAQAEGPSKKRHRGIGLGLAISSKLVELMAGRIWVQSEVGRGSTFHFTARFGPAPPDAVVTPRASAVSSEERSVPEPTPKAILSRRPS